MAFFEEDNEDQLDPNAEQPTQLAGSEGALVGGGGASNANPAASPAQASAGAAPSSNNFVGIQKYLDVNKSQAGKLGNQVGSYVEGTGQEARNTIGEQGNLFNTQADQNTVNLDQDVFNQAKVKAQDVAADQQKKQTFVNMRDAQYKGPASFEESEFYQPTKQVYDKAQTATSNTLNEQGQKQLIKDIQKDDTKRINEGALTFDTMLLQDKGAKNTLAQARDKNKDLQSVLDANSAKALEKAAQAKKVTDATRGAVQDAFTGEKSVIKNLEGDISNKVAELSGKAKADAQAIQSKIANMQDLSEAELKKAGITQDQYQAYKGARTDLQNYNPDPKNDLIGKIMEPLGSLSGWAAATLRARGGGGIDYNQFGRPQYAAGPDFNNEAYFTNYNVDGANEHINAGNVADQEQYARYAALNDLMGTNNQFLSSANVDKAGTASDDLIDLNYDRLMGDIRGAKSQKERTYRDFINNALNKR